MNSAECVFCRILAGTLDAQIVDENERAVAILDIYPANPGHVVVFPRRHVKNLFDIEQSDLDACISLARSVALKLRDRLSAQGVNLLNSNEAVAWQSVFHFHIHVIPRYENDPLRLPWEPATADSAVLGRLADRLRVSE